MPLLEKSDKRLVNMPIGHSKGAEGQNFRPRIKNQTIPKDNGSRCPALSCFSTLGA